MPLFKNVIYQSTDLVFLIFQPEVVGLFFNGIIRTSIVNVSVFALVCVYVCKDLFPFVGLKITNLLLPYCVNFLLYTGV